MVPFFASPNTRCRIILRTPKGTINLTATYIGFVIVAYGTYLTVQYGVILGPLGLILQGWLLTQIFHKPLMKVGLLNHVWILHMIEVNLR